MAIGIDPTVDFAFKKLMGSPDHPALTLSFINAVLGGQPLITSVEILNPFIDKGFEDDKLAILDVKAKDDHGRWLNIEMQTTLPGELPSRLAFYVASQYTGQMQEGDHYRDLTPSIGICVLSGILFKEVPDLHLDFRLRSHQPAVKLTDSLQIHLLELPKYALPRDNEQITDPIEKWAYFLRQATGSSPQQLVDRLGEEVFAEAAGVLEMIAKSPRERELYEARLKMQRDEQSRIDAATDQARAEGQAQGRVEGLSAGRLIGRIQVLQDLLGLPESSDKELASQSLDQLAAIERELERQRQERDVN
jgi:predicted transposase/invertase (TIGR01784 family)